MLDPLRVSPDAGLRRARLGGLLTRHWDAARATAGQLPGGYYHRWTMFGAANVKLHAVSIAADLSRPAEARNHAEDIDPEEIPSRVPAHRLAPRRAADARPLDAGPGRSSELSRKQQG